PDYARHPRAAAGSAMTSLAQAVTSRPVKYMTATPVARPPITVRSRRRPVLSRSAGEIWVITWVIAPTPTPSSTADNAGLSTAAPMTAPRIAGAPATAPRPISDVIGGR